MVGLCLVTRAQEIVKGDPPRDRIVYYCAPCGCPHDDHYFIGMGSCPSCNMTLQPVIIGKARPNNSIQPPTVGILLYDGVDVMDVSGPLSVFEHANFNVVTFAESSAPVRVGTTVEFNPDFTYHNLPEVDIMVLPGGVLAEMNPEDQNLVELILEKSKETDIIFSVCSGAFFLGEAGLLNEKKATTFASLIPSLRANYPKAEVLNNVKYTDNGQVITSAGLSSGIDAAFHVVSRYYGIGRAQDIANHMEYPWARQDDYARSQLADNFLLGIRRLMSLFSKDFYYSQGDQTTWEYRFGLTGMDSPKDILNMLSQELDMNNNWTWVAKSSSSLVGKMDHPVLGPGEVRLKHDVLADKRPALIISARRLSDSNN